MVTPYPATPLTRREFAETDGLDDWRYTSGGASTVFAVPSFSAGAEFAIAIATLADELDHHPDVDLRQRSVTVRTMTHAVNSLTDRDVVLARGISALARERGLTADPSTVQTVMLGFDTVDRAAVMPFWQAALGYRARGDAELVDARRRGPLFWFGETDAHRPPRNRIHVDVSVPHDQAEARVQAVLAAGGRMLGDTYAPAFWSLIDAEGNVADIATWQGLNED